MKARLRCYANSSRAELRTMLLLRWNAILAVLFVVLGFSFTSCRRQKDAVRPAGKVEEMHEHPALLYGIPYQVYEQRKSEIKE